MPRALLVSEILANIISYLDVNLDERAARRKGRYVTSSGPTLFALALTCRAFSEQALDALWGTLIGFEPLMRCAGIIPPREKRVEDDKDYPIIPTEAQLIVIGRYANRVRYMSFPRWSRPVRSFLQTLAYSSKVLMPNLRDLKVETDGHSVHLLHLLLGLRLQHLSIDVSDFHCPLNSESWQRISLLMILRSLPRTCPSLESFVFGHFYSSQPDLWDPPLALPVSYAIQNLQKLRVIAVPAITKDALACLGGISSLTSITTQLPTGSDLEHVFGSSHSPILFENVDSVDWEIQEWRDVEVFTRLWPSKLTSMLLQSEVTFDPSLLQVLFDSLHTREAFRNLQRIRLHECGWRVSTRPMVITIDTIRPLFYLGRLRVLDIDTRSCVSIGENDLVEMAEAWHCLEVLLLNETNGSMSGAAPMPRRITLSGVVRFVELYPRLKELCIGITISTVHDEYDMDKENLRTLKPRDSDSRLESLVMKHPGDEEHIWETYEYDGKFDILFGKLFPQLKPEKVRLEPDTI
ncbi:hypothetical protein EDB19DRAFT_246175 [Suillus lakei]|nr:hypothetical protein EDB19DRAFT_246175 [Suillus lakei]